MPTLSVPFPTDKFTTRGKPLPPMPNNWRNLVKAIVRQSRKTPHKTFAYDNYDGTTITFRELVQRSVAASRVLGRKVGQGKNVGILLPPGIPGAIANLAVAMSGNVIVNVNLLSEQIANGVVADATATHVITSRAFLEKFKNLKVNAEYVYLEDFPDAVTTHDRARAFNVSNVWPLTGMSEILPGAAFKLKDTAALMYTSGSTGTPKGAELTNEGILANIWQIKHHMNLKDDEVLLSCLPFFHSFGFTVTLFAPMVLGLTAVFHPNAREGDVIGELIEDRKITMVLSTPTFSRMFWLKKISKKQMRSVRTLMMGSEPLKAELARDIKETWGIDASEGYGTTEFTPAVSANITGKVRLEDGRVINGTKLGSVGLPMPETYVAIVDEESGEVLKAGQKTADGTKYRQGLIFLKGRQSMKGYLNRVEETEAVLRKGWYYTADIGRVDEDGFLYITGRAGRRIKIGAEMVPLIYIENAIREATGLNETDFITEGVPDEMKGERLVLLYTTLGNNPDGSPRSPADVLKLLSATKLPTLWTPKANSFFRMDDMPINPTGKLDLKEVKKRALQFAGTAS